MLPHADRLPTDVADTSSKQEKSARLALIMALIAFGAVMRLVPHPWNLAPVGAIGLFGGAHFRRATWALCIPLAAMFLSDCVLELALGRGRGFHVFMPFTYLAFLGYVALGRWLATNRRADRVLFSVLAGSSLYFVVTNLGYWLLSPSDLPPPFGYPKTLSGLVTCYWLALPFAPATFVGDLIYSAALFGVFALAERAVPALAPAQAAGK